MSKTSKLQDRYVAVIDRGHGKEAIEVKLDYDFYGKGIILPPIIKGSVDNLSPSDPHYSEVEFVLVDSQQSAAKSFSTSQQQIARWIKNHERVNDMELDQPTPTSKRHDKPPSDTKSNIRDRKLLMRVGWRN